MALELMLVSLLEAVANAPPGNQEFVASVLNEAASNAKLLADRGVPRRRHRHLYVAHTAYYPPDSGEPWLAQCGSVASRLVRRAKPSWSRRWVDEARIRRQRAHPPINSASPLLGSSFRARCKSSVI